MAGNRTEKNMEWQKRTDQTLENQVETWYTKMRSATDGEYIFYHLNYIISSSHCQIYWLAVLHFSLLVGMPGYTASCHIK
ncbi:hypothetical protein HMPREF3213_03763 [Heyndrickxia coagulans]|uniref:Uncharacterized protein n=1 Tax=Heyndrickxia coagulans TaxID=1398 RepID=A0A133KAE0_HEYCO|nr:hypothetical protein HMPREF3213_03763 [Heyndrickxia coagulans]